MLETTHAPGSMGRMSSSPGSLRMSPRQGTIFSTHGSPPKSRKLMNYLLVVTHDSFLKI